MFFRSFQDATYGASFGIERTNGIRTICQRDGTVETQIHDDFCLVQEAVHMARRVILRIRDKQNAGEANRCHIPP